MHCMQVGSRPLCRCESIILLGDHTWLLTELSNVVAYACRHSLKRIDIMSTAQVFIRYASAGNQGFSHQGFAARPNALKLLADPASAEQASVVLRGSPPVIQNL